MTEGRDYELEPRLDGESYDEEEEYRLIPEDEEETLDPDQDYDIPTNPRTSTTTEVRPKSALKCGFVNHSNSNNRDSSQGIPIGQTFNSNSTIPQVNRMSGSDIKLPIFNGNRLDKIIYRVLNHKYSSNHDT